MTNYNERLDEIIQALAMSEQGVADDFAVGAIDEGTYQVRDDVARDETKQALTSLTKELVAKAKPTKHIHHYAYGKPFEDAQDIAYNAAINQFEQNLLKALDEV